MSADSDIKIRPATSDDMRSILDGLRDYYWPYEPLSISHRIKTVSPTEEAFLMYAAEEGLSLVAIDPTQNDKIFGFLTICITTPTFFEEFSELVKDQPHDERFAEIGELFNKLEQGWDLFEIYNVDKVFSLFCLGVHPSMRGKSIGIELVREGLRTAELQGFKVVSVDCTSYYSAQIMEQAGMECIGQIDYKDYVDVNGEQIFKPPPMHTHLRRFVKLL